MATNGTQADLQRAERHAAEAERLTRYWPVRDTVSSPVPVAIDVARA